ncbi:hypothetical protein [Ensifer sp. ENS11]|uniref:hypothetical protein n=1 Tax=Ensifer sp. ENS11 TaxID=2769291 RepID=UPI00178473CA|nr:hypothetical protein [Ensifer sp. ENS11]MBD9491483.1 hypothetical protein [Ensifer sp. ENS11]
MAKHRIHSMEFKRQVAQEFVAGIREAASAFPALASRELFQAIKGSAEHGTPRKKFESAPDG